MGRAQVVMDKTIGHRIRNALAILLTQVNAIVTQPIEPSSLARIALAALNRFMMFAQGNSGLRKQHRFGDRCESFIEFTGQPSVQCLILDANAVP